MSNDVTPPVIPAKVLPKPPIVAVDFDGTCVTHEYPNVGRDIGAARVLHMLVAAGYRIILWTMRSGKYLDDAVNWFNARNIPLWGINSNPEQAEWTASPKAYAQTYIDDAALGVPLCRGLPGERPYVDWDTVGGLLEAMIVADKATVRVTLDGLCVVCKKHLHLHGSLGSGTVLCPIGKLPTEPV